MAPLNPVSKAITGARRRGISNSRMRRRRSMLGKYRARHKFFDYAPSEEDTEFRAALSPR